MPQLDQVRHRDPHRRAVVGGEERRGQPLDVPVARIPLPRSTVAALRSDQVQLGFRPEAMTLASQEDTASFPVEALVIEELGSDAFLYGNLIGDDLRDDHIVARIAPRSVPVKGAKVWFTVQPGQMHAFDVETGDALPTD